MILRFFCLARANARGSSNSLKNDFTYKLMQNIEKDSEEFYIAGLYRPRKNPSNEVRRHYYYHYIYNITKRKVIEFNNSDMW